MMGGGKLSASEQRFHLGVIFNYTKFRSNVLELDSLPESLHWLPWNDLPREAQRLFFNECYRSSTTGYVDFSEASRASVDKLETTDSMLWLSQSIQQLATYYADKGAKDRNKAPVVDLANVPVTSVLKDPPTTIYHPRHSKFYTFVFVVAKSVSDIVTNNDVRGGGSCGYHSLVRAILHFVKEGTRRI